MLVERFFDKIMTNVQFSCIIFHQNFIEIDFCLHICMYTGIYVFYVSVGMKVNTGDLCYLCFTH